MARHRKKVYLQSSDEDHVNTPCACVEYLSLAGKYHKVGINIFEGQYLLLTVTNSFNFM